MRGPLKAADEELEVERRAVTGSGDDNTSAAKPQVDWDDSAAWEELVDSRARDTMAVIIAVAARSAGTRSRSCAPGLPHHLRVSTTSTRADELLGPL